MKQICWTAIVGLSIALGAAAQDNGALNQARQVVTTGTQNVPVLARIIGPETTMLAAPVMGAPYSADEVTTFTQTLGDGTHIRREDKVMVYRDSQGRLRRETPTQITISDPVAGVAYTLDPNKLTARKVTVSISNFTPAVRRDLEDAVAAAVRTATAVAGGGSGPNTFIFVGGNVQPKTSANRQSLGSQSIEGVLSEGTSMTQTVPAGSIGNDRDIQVVNENWYSPELKTMIMTKHSDPRTGEEVFRLTNIRRDEPSPDLFLVPPGYQTIGTGAPMPPPRPVKQD
jgi:hypothetical protein